MLKIDNIKLNPSYTKSDLIKKVAERLKISESEIKSYKLLKKSVDARNKRKIQYIISLAVELKNENPIDLTDIKNCSEYIEIKYKIPEAKFIPKKRPVIVGFGPAGMFCAIAFAYAGIKPLIIERGKPVRKRVSDVEAFFERGILNINSNIQFGEGGAGTFSDGKLTTGTKDSVKPL